MKILLTGPFGNVGSHAIPELLREGHALRCFDLDRPSTRRVAKEHGRRIETVWGDVRDPRALARAAEGVEAVIHLAAMIPPEADEEPEAPR